MCGGQCQDGITLSALRHQSCHLVFLNVAGKPIYIAVRLKIDTRWQLALFESHPETQSAGLLFQIGSKGFISSIKSWACIGHYQDLRWHIFFHPFLNEAEYISGGRFLN